MSQEPTEEASHTCPHCGAELKKWQAPEDSTWGGMIRLVCFNDDCPYYVRGWDVMMERQCVSASYRCMHNPKTGTSKPLPVWSKTAHRDGIVE